jgi:hypothetical protein
MNVEELLNAYRRVAERGNRLPEMDSADVEMSCECLHSAVGAWESIVAFAPVAGWLGCQSQNRAFTATPPPAPDTTTGVLLYAECVNSDGYSLHLRYNGAGAWLLTRFTPHQGNTYLCDTVKLIATDSNLGSLRYRRYWQLDPQHGAEPFTACFIGFEQERG